MPRRISCRIDTSPQDVRYSERRRSSLRSSAFIVRPHARTAFGSGDPGGLREARHPWWGRLQASRCSLRSSAVFYWRDRSNCVRLRGSRGIARGALSLWGEASSKPVLASLVGCFLLARSLELRSAHAANKKAGCLRHHGFLGGEGGIRTPGTV